MKGPVSDSSATYNAVVIGAGTAGLVVAAATAGLGGRVALIERGPMGGDCLNFGCVPSKALISSARVADRMRRADVWGFQAHEPKFSFRDVVARVRARRAQIAPHDSQERFEQLGVEVFRGEATFHSPNEVRVGSQTLRGARIVIATGTSPAVPDLPGLSDVPYFTNETIFDELEERPRSMIVLGGGPIGCELSQAFARLGVKITLVQRGSRLLPKEDAEVGEVIVPLLERDGVCCRTNLEAKSIRKTGDGISLTVSGNRGEEVIEAQALLIATGRRPNTSALDLAKAGLSSGPRGLEVNSRLQTSQPHIFAAGDIVGPYHFTHMADYQARIVARNILMPFSFLYQKAEYSTVPWATYLDPEVGRVGMNEDEARARNVAYDIYRSAVPDLDRAVVEDETEGFVKILTARGTDRILGVTMVASHAGDLIHEFALAMKHRIGLGQISSVIHAYPTFAELARKTGDAYQKTRLTPRVRRLFGWLYQMARHD